MEVRRNLILSLASCPIHPHNNRDNASVMQATCESREICRKLNVLSIVEITPGPSHIRSNQGHRNMNDYRLTRLVENLPATVPFVGPETQERQRGAAFAARIGANESVFGPSPKVVEAVARSIRDAWMYGDPENHDLRHALAEHHGVAAENVMVGEGIDGILGYAARMFVDSGDTVVTSAGAYPTFNYHVNGYGGKLVFLPYKDDHEDWRGLLDLASAENAKLLYFANPDNPMGTWWDADAVQVMMRQVPQGTVLLVDEAYGEFAPADALPEVDVSNPQVLRLRTFSKAYGLAGMRVGYALGERGLIAEFNKVRNHFGMGRVAQAAALAALADQEHLQQVIRQVAQARERIATIAAQHGLTPLESAANFVAIDAGRDGAFATAVLNDLVRQGVFVRMPGVAPLNRCIRVTAGWDHQLDTFAEALPLALAHVRANP